MLKVGVGRAGLSNSRPPLFLEAPLDVGGLEMIYQTFARKTMIHGTGLPSSSRARSPHLSLYEPEEGPSQKSHTMDLARSPSMALGRGMLLYCVWASLPCGRGISTYSSVDHITHTGTSYDTSIYLYPGCICCVVISILISWSFVFSYDTYDIIPPSPHVFFKCQKSLNGSCTPALLVALHGARVSRSTSRPRPLQIATAGRLRLQAGHRISTSPLALYLPC